MRNNQYGAIDMMLAALLVVLLAIGGFVAYRANQANEETAKTAAATESGSNSIVNSGGDNANTDAGPEPSGTVVEPPEGFELVKDESVSYFYPEGWPAATLSSQPISSAVFEIKFWPSISYDLEAEQWVAADSNYEGYTKGDLVDDINPVKPVHEGDLTIYNFGFADAGCGASKYVFISGNSVYDLVMPGVCGADIPYFIVDGERAGDVPGGNINVSETITSSITVNQ